MSEQKKTIVPRDVWDAALVSRDEGEHTFATAPCYTADRWILENCEPELAEKIMCGADYDGPRFSDGEMASIIAAEYAGLVDTAEAVVKAWDKANADEKYDECKYQSFAASQSIEAMIVELGRLKGGTP